MKRSSIVLGCVVSVVTVSTASTGCGARAPLDFEIYDQNSSVSALDGSTSSPDAAKPDGGGPGKDSGPDGNPLINCGSCVTTQCGQVMIACVTDTGCRDVLQCALLNCVQGGLDQTCLFKCAAGSPTGALQAAGVFQCVATKCGDSCIAALGSGGGGGRGNGGAPESSNLEARQAQRSAMCEMMSPWNELTCSQEQQIAR